MLIQFGAEDDVANLRNIYNAQQHARLIQNRQEVVVAAAYLAHQLAHLQIRTYGMIIFLYDILHAQQRERSLVDVVGEQLALSCQTQGVDAVALEDADGEQRRDAHNHQRHEELVAAREFGDEEDARKRGMHHARYETRHAHECKVLLRNVDAHLVHIPEARKEETGKTANDERRGKGTTASATAVGCRGGKNLGKGYQGDVEDEQLVVPVEERTAHHLSPVFHILSLQQHVDCRIALAVERREEEDERTQNQSAKQQFYVWIRRKLGKEALARRHGAHEIKAHQAAENAQQKAGRHAVERPRTGKRKIEKTLGAHQDVGKASSCYTTDKDRQQGSHAQVYHQHLKRKYESGNGRLEDAGNGCRSAAAHQQNHGFLVHAENLAQV